jgi:hypothetical protein
MSTPIKTSTIAPLTDTIIVAVARLVDDAQAHRDPSHSAIDFEIARAGLKAADPKFQGQLVGKAKRLRMTLSHALANDPDAGGALVTNMVSLIRGCGGFRNESDNYVGAEAITNAACAFRSEGFELTSDGELRSLLLDNLTGTALSDALGSYVRRAKRGYDDAALVTGTGKDLLEATAAHIVSERWGSASAAGNFPLLLGRAFTALGMDANASTPPAADSQKRFERALYEAGCAVNNLRNKQGTGHGRPWLPAVSDPEARAAVETMGIIAELLLTRHRQQP